MPRDLDFTGGQSIQLEELLIITQMTRPTTSNDAEEGPMTYLRMSIFGTNQKAPQWVPVTLVSNLSMRSHNFYSNELILMYSS